MFKLCVMIMFVRVENLVHAKNTFVPYWVNLPFTLTFAFLWEYKSLVPA